MVIPGEVRKAARHLRDQTKPTNLHALCGVWDMWYGTVLVDIKIWVMNWDI